jgi:preprotein translocase subunit Sec61beta
MKKPLTLKILSLVTAIIGCLRVYSGVFAISKNWDYLSQTNQMPYIIIANFLVGLLVILAGLFSFYGKSSGRMILIAGIAISLIINFVNFRKIDNVALLTLIAILYFVIPDIQKYFSQK